MAKDFDLLVGNAFDFLSKAISEVESQPKFSIINFYSAVEIFLKARLLADHWSLVVNKDADRKKFEAGDFVSVSFEVACDRLNKVVQSPLPDATRKSFDTIRKHRNLMVHFHHAIQAPDPQLTSTIIKEQFVAWHHLHKLLTIQWSDQFTAFGGVILDIEKALKHHRDFLAAKFDDLAEELKATQAAGKILRECWACKFQAAVGSLDLGSLYDYSCKVCDHKFRALRVECESCEKEADYDAGDFTCTLCGHKEKQETLIKRLDGFVATKDNYFEAPVPANCAWCDGCHTVIEHAEVYLCLSCFEYVYEVEFCGWCNEPNTGDMSESYMMGCNQCEGSGGWHASKDD